VLTTPHGEVGCRLRGRKDLGFQFERQEWLIVSPPGDVSRHTSSFEERGGGRKRKKLWGLARSTELFLLRGKRWRGGEGFLQLPIILRGGEEGALRPIGAGADEFPMFHRGSSISSEGEKKGRGGEKRSNSRRF